MASLPNLEPDAKQARVCVLIVSGGGHDKFFVRLLPRLGWQCHQVEDWHEAREYLESYSVPIAIATDVEALRNWQETIRSPWPLEHPPKLLVTSHSVEEDLWPGLTKLGAFDVFMEPFDERNIANVMSLAHTQWQDEEPRQDGPRSFYFVSA